MERHFKDKNKPMNSKEFQSKLAEAERFGILAVCEVCSAALESEKPDYYKLLSWTKALMEAAENAYCRKDKELTSTYLFLYHNMWEYAKNCLNLLEYHRFCGNQIENWELIYLN